MDLQTEGKGQVGRNGRRRKDIMKMNLKGMGMS
jgi:hypothetical protein